MSHTCWDCNKSFGLGEQTFSLGKHFNDNDPPLLLITPLHQKQTKTDEQANIPYVGISTQMLLW